MTWNEREIVREAKNRARPQHFKAGDLIAWTLHSYAGHTDGVSEIHRVYDAAMTYCEEGMPDFMLLLPPLRSLDTCLTCKERHAAGWEKPVASVVTGANAASENAERVA